MWFLLNPMSMSEDDWEKTSMNKMVHEDSSISQTLTPSQNESSLMTKGKMKLLKAPWVGTETWRHNPTNTNMTV